MLEPVYCFFVLLLRRMYLAVAFIIYYKCSINYNDPFSGKHIFKKKNAVLKNVLHRINQELFI